MRPIALALLGVATLAGVVAYTAPAANQERAPIFVTDSPPGYRDWRLISVAHEEGNFHSFSAVLGNDLAIQAYREGKVPFPDGAIIAALHYRHVPSEDIVRAVRARGASLKATEQPIDTGTAAGKCFLDMLGVFAEFETNLRPRAPARGHREGEGGGRLQGPTGHDRRRPGARNEGPGARRLGNREDAQDRPGVGLSGAGSWLTATRPDLARRAWGTTKPPQGPARSSSRHDALADAR
jgi:Cytochrome P460/Resolvase, N terminal domain